MKINLTQVLTTLDGKPLKKSEIIQGKIYETEISYTLKNAIIDALMEINPEEKISAEEKIKRYSLATKAYELDEVELDEQSISFIKEQIGKLHSVLITGQCFKLLSF